jgi:hypothetical protein
MPLFFTFIFLSDDTLQDITSHNFLYDEAGVYEWSCCGITWITSYSCDEAGAS